MASSIIAGQHFQHLVFGRKQPKTPLANASWVAWGMKLGPLVDASQLVTADSAWGETQPVLGHDALSKVEMAVVEIAVRPIRR